MENVYVMKIKDLKKYLIIKLICVFVKMIIHFIEILKNANQMKN